MTSSELPAVETGAGTRTRPCEWCGEPVQQPAVGRARRHCKRSHRQRAYEARRLLALQDAAAAGARATAAAEADDAQAERVLAAARAQLAKADKLTEPEAMAAAATVPAPEQPPVPDDIVPAVASEPEPVLVSEVAPVDGTAEETQPVITDVRPQGMARKKALAIADAAVLEKAPDWKESSRWVVRSGDLVLGIVMPSYGGVSRSGRNGWTYRVGGAYTGDRRPTRDSAAMQLRMSWVRIVTAKPSRTLTGPRK